MEKKMKRGVEWGDNQPTNFGESRFFFRGWPAGVAMVAMVATGQKSTLGAVARHPGADVG